MTDTPGAPGGQYPGPDPSDQAADPFDKPIDETAPIQPAATPPPAAQQEEIGYWERQAREQQAGQQQTTPAPPAPGQPDYVQNPTTAQYASTPPPRPSGPQDHNPWAGYGASAPPGGVPPTSYGGTPAAPQYGAPGTPYYGAPVMYQPSHPQATTAMVLGLIGLVGALFFCGVTLVVSPFAWVIGSRALREIRASGGQLGGESNAKAGMIMGIIGTVLLVLAIIALIVFIVFIVVAANSSSGFSTNSSEF